MYSFSKFCQTSQVLLRTIFKIKIVLETFSQLLGCEVKFSNNI